MCLKRPLWDAILQAQQSIDCGLEDNRNATNSHSDTLALSIRLLRVLKFKIKCTIKLVNTKLHEPLLCCLSVILL